jgi:hypothetical protein
MTGLNFLQQAQLLIIKRGDSHRVALAPNQ